MCATANTRLEHTLDPQDWNSLRTLGHRMVDEMLAFLENIREHASERRFDRRRLLRSFRAALVPR